jgi:hypothetical protein
MLINFAPLSLLQRYIVTTYLFQIFKMSILHEDKDDDLLVLCHQTYLEETLQLAARKSIKKLLNTVKKLS